MRFDAFVLMLTGMLLALAGCSSGKIIEASRPAHVPVPYDELAMKLASASVVDSPGATPDVPSHLYLCVIRIFGRSETSFRIRVTEPYPFADAPRHDRPFEYDGKSLVLASGLDKENVQEGCGLRDGEALVRQLPIIRTSSYAPVPLPRDSTDAIVDASQRNSELKLTYLCAAPVFGGYHSVKIDLSRSDIYWYDRGARPYFLLLLPLSPLIDLAALGAIGLAIIEDAGHHHSL